MPWCAAGSLPLPESLWSHFVVFWKRSLRSEREIHSQRSLLPQAVSLEFGLRDPLHLSVMSPWSDPLLLQGRMGVTKWGPIPLRNELIFGTAGFPGFLMYPVSWLQRVKGQVVGVGSTWLPYFMRVFTISSTWRACLSCSISRGFRCPFSVLGLAYTGFNELNFNLSLGDNCKGRAIRSNLIQFSWIS